METPAFAYCGLNCEQCPVFIAAADNNDDLRVETAREWTRLYGAYLSATLGRDRLKPEDMNCSGCRSEGGLFVGCTNCPIRTCCREKGFVTCASCKGYEVCDMLKMDSLLFTREQRAILRN